MDPQRFSAKAKEDRVRREKRGLHEYVPRDEPIVPLCAVGPPSPVSGLVHEDDGLHEDLPRDEPIGPLCTVGPPSPVSGLVHEDDVPRDVPSMFYGLLDEDSRYPDILPCIFEFIGVDESHLLRQLNIPCWREVNICLALLRTEARHWSWSIQTRECVNLMRSYRPIHFGPNFMATIQGGRYFEC